MYGGNTPASRRRTAAVMLALSLAISACALDAPGASENPPAETATLTSTSPKVTAPEMESAVNEEDMSRLDLSAQETTFLSSIEDAVDDQRMPDAHYYVEYELPTGVVWQGERLSYADGDVLFLQQAAGDGTAALRIEGPSATDQGALESLLTQTTAVEGEPANVEVQHVRARLSSPGDSVDEPSTWSFDVTIAHPDTGWEDYADGWHVETMDGQILGTRILLHPHVGEQPFTRSLSGVVVPGGVDEVHIRAHDLISGYGSAGVPIKLSEPGTEEGYEVVR